MLDVEEGDGLAHRLLEPSLPSVCTDESSLMVRSWSGIYLMHSTLTVTRQSLVHTALVQQPRQQGLTAMSARTSDIPPVLHHPFLAAINLVVNAEFRFLICQLCQEGVAMSTTQSHIANQHPSLLYAFKRDQFCQAVEEMALVLDLPNIITGPRPIIQGLPVHSALACDQCPAVFSFAKKMNDHYHCHHQELPIPKTFRECNAQRMRAKGAGKQRTFWEVTTPEKSTQDSAVADMVDKLMKELDGQPEVVQVVSDDRLISPWLLTTRWHEHVASVGEATEQQQSWVSLPRANAEESHLRDPNLIHSRLALFFILMFFHL